MNQLASLDVSFAVTKPRVLLVASKGGHWDELSALMPAFQDVDPVVVSTARCDFGASNPSVIIQDYSQSEPFKVLSGFLETLRLLRETRPDVVVSTGAAPGVLCLFWGRFLGAKTIWIDSVANAERLSLSGRFASWFCHTVLTQWDHLANRKVQYWGRVL